MTFTTRFAPSPTGPLHLGHAYSAILAHDMARRAGGTFLLRIEDIDQTRSRPEWETQIYEDLAWLGLSWDAPPSRQSDHLTRYEEALASLWSQGLLYPCYCSRKDIQAAASAPQEGAMPSFGADGLVYPGTCRRDGDMNKGSMPSGVTLRLDMRKALKKIAVSGNLWFQEIGKHPGTPQKIHVSSADLITKTGDIVLSRKDFLGSYHLSVVCDDAAAQITHVVRGEDLFEATDVHVVLQRLMGHRTPVYCHHRLIRDAQGKRLAKRDDARALSKYRACGTSPKDIRQLTGLS